MFITTFFGEQKRFPIPMDGNADTRHLSKLRRWAARKREVHACLSCKSKKTKCSIFRPCIRCKYTGSMCIDNNKDASTCSDFFMTARSFSVGSVAEGKRSNLKYKPAYNFGNDGINYHVFGHQERICPQLSYSLNDSFSDVSINRTHDI